MAGNWTWVLADQNGNELTELATATGRTLTFKRNTYAEAACAISHDDDEGQVFFDTLATGTPRLHCYRDGVRRFKGALAPFDEELEDAATVSLVFRSPFAQLVGDGADRGRFTGPETDAASMFLGTDAGLIAKALIDTTNAAHGFTGLATTGAIQPTKVRDRTYNNANVGQSVVNLSNVLDGFDFFEDFAVDGSTLAQFVVVARQGIEQANAKFEYGADTLNNVRNVRRTTEPPINLAVVLGGNGLSSTPREDAASRAARGTWMVQQTQSDVTEQLTLDDRAQALIRPAPVKVLTFSPDPEIAPRPWDDYWLGDTVYFFGRRKAFTESTPVRVNSITVVIDDEGNEAFEIPDPLTPGEEATIRSQLGVEVTDANG